MAMCTPAGMESDSDDEYDYSAVDSGYSEVPRKSSVVAATPTQGDAVAAAELLSAGDNTGTNGFSATDKKYPPSPRWRRHKMADTNNVTLLTEDFHYAVISGNIPKIKDMLSNGFDVDMLLKGGWTGLMYACSTGQPDIVQFLLQQKADPNFHKDMFTPLMAVCGSSVTNEDDLLTCVEHLLHVEVNINAYDRFHMTPLLYAARDGRIEIVKRLLQGGAQIDRRDSKGWSALAYAAHHGHGPIVRLLLENQADSSNLCHTGQTPADLAYCGGHTEIAQILENADTKNKSAADSRHLATLDRLKPTLEVLEDPGGADMNSNTKYTHYGNLELVLGGLSLSNLIPLFHQHDIEFSVFLRMKDEDFEKIGVKQYGVRHKLLDAINDIHKKEWEPSSIGALEGQRQITCVDAVAMLANIARHLSCIQSSIVHLDDRIKANPRMLELEQDVQDVHSLIKHTLEATVNCGSLSAELKTLHTHLNMVKDHVNLNQADLITSPNPRGRRGSWTWTAIVLTSAMVAGTVWARPGVLRRVILLT